MQAVLLSNLMTWYIVPFKWSASDVTGVAHPPCLTCDSRSDVCTGSVRRTAPSTALKSLSIKSTQPFYPTKCCCMRLHQAISLSINATMATICHFWRLPRELRDQIYRLAHVEVGPIRIGRQAQKVYDQGEWSLLGKYLGVANGARGTY